MATQASRPGSGLSPAEQEIRTLYRTLLAHWNQHNAGGMAALFTADGNTVGFDGSQMNGADEIEQTLGQIFADHMTAAYVAIVREVRFLTPDTALLRAVVGMIPPGKSDINPATNAVQSLVAVKQAGAWQIALFHNTPAALHGRPELSEQLTAELRQVLATERTP
jgi:uncharacterized protein (TIGR02246 family)